MSENRPSAEWQWSAEIPSIVSDETDGPLRAFLWIPPDCHHLRGVVVGQHALQEEPILEHTVFRVALREVGFAAIWVTPAFDPVFEVAEGAGKLFDSMLAALAAESGYDELVRVPIVPLGHSAAASFPWNFGRWAPDRTLAVISVSGQWPTPQEDANADFVPEPFPPGIPGLVSLGEYEWADERAGIGLKQRAAYPDLPLTLLAEAGAGHFDVSAEKVAYLALYLRKAAAHRIPATWNPARDPAPVLRAIDPLAEGWLVDRWRAHEPTRVPAAPVAEYAEPDEAFWCFDEEHAVATEKYRQDQRGKRTALLGFVQGGAILPQMPNTHQQVTIPFLPLDDGLTFQLSATFITTVPKGRPERWTGLKEGTALPSPGPAIPVSIERICGPVQKLAPDTFALRFSRVGLNHRNRTPEIWLVATHPGDAQFKRSVQQALLRIPLRNEAGAEQIITFDPIPPPPAGAKQITLTATSSAGVPVHFYVREGPAEIAADGRTLVLLPVPPRAKRPIKITVVAWQWGRTIEPQLRTATPVAQTLQLLTDPRAG